jgi:sugar transferase EpsL
MLSGFLILLLLPIIIIIIIIVYITDGRPILFKQMRPGLNSNSFLFYKFRTMNSMKNNKGVLLPDQERITKIGRFLRQTSLDELPSLFNVLKGDMSLVGPRPLLMEYLPLYSPYQSLRHNVKPGITGWAQINGRNSISWEEKFKLDIWYIENKNFYLDIKILFITLIKVINKEGINESEFTTMSKFKGD